MTTNFRWCPWVSWVIGPTIKSDFQGETKPTMWGPWGTPPSLPWKCENPHLNYRIQGPRAPLVGNKSMIYRGYLELKPWQIGRFSHQLSSNGLLWGKTYRKTCVFFSQILHHLGVLRGGCLQMFLRSNFRKGISWEPNEPPCLFTENTCQ